MNNFSEFVNDGLNKRKSLYASSHHSREDEIRRRVTFPIQRDNLGIAPSEEMQRRGYMGATKKMRAVKHIESGKIYTSMIEAYRDHGDSYNKIIAHANGKAKIPEWCFAVAQIIPEADNTAKLSRRCRHIDTKMEFDSINIASKETGDSVSKISMHCNDKSTQKHWEFIDKLPRKIKHRIRNMATGIIYDSRLEAHEKTGDSEHRITDHCKNRCKNKVWEYVK